MMPAMMFIGNLTYVGIAVFGALMVLSSNNNGSPVGSPMWGDAADSATDKDGPRGRGRARRRLEAC